MNQSVLVEIKDRVLTLTINRPERRNALTREMYQMLREQLVSAASNDEVRVVIITGTGGHFTAGNDLKEFLEASPGTGDDYPLQFIRDLTNCPVPVIAAVQGSAVGIGTTMLLHCDLVVVAEDATFQLPFVNLGLCPEAASSLLLPRSAGMHLASELFLTGRSFGAETAWQCGFVNKIVESQLVLEEAVRYATRIASFPARSVQLTKELLKAPLRKEISATIESESVHFRSQLSSPEAEEAFTAFFEKRPADFSRF